MKLTLSAVGVLLAMCGSPAIPDYERPAVAPATFGGWRLKSDPCPDGYAIWIGWKLGEGKVPERDRVVVDDPGLAGRQSVNATCREKR